MPIIEDPTKFDLPNIREVVDTIESGLLEKFAEAKRPNAVTEKLSTHVLVAGAYRVINVEISVKFTKAFASEQEAMAYIERLDGDMVA